MDKIKAAVKIKAAAEKIKAAAEKIKAPMPNPDKIKAAEKIKAELPPKIKAFLGTISDALGLDDTTKEKIKDRVNDSNSVRIMEDGLFLLIEKCGCYVALPEDYDELNINYDEIRTELEKLEKENSDLRSIAARLKMDYDECIARQQNETLIKQTEVLVGQNKVLLDILTKGELLVKLKTSNNIAEKLLEKLKGYLIKSD